MVETVRVLDHAYGLADDENAAAIERTLQAGDARWKMNRRSSQR
jgi:hypothetical protein